MRISTRQPTPISPAQREQATHAAKEMALFSALSGTGWTPVASAPRIKPGTTAFISSAKYDYQALVKHYGGAKLPAAFRVRALTPDVAQAVKTFAAQHRGTPEVALNTIDGQSTFQVQVPTKDATQVLLLGSKGQELARGSVNGTTLRWS